MNHITAQALNAATTSPQGSLANDPLYLKGNNPAPTVQQERMGNLATHQP